jgi:hypothetical protein
MSLSNTTVLVIEFSSSQGTELVFFYTYNEPWTLNFFFFFLLVVLGFELGASHLLGKCSIT